MKIFKKINEFKCFQSHQNLLSNDYFINLRLSSHLKLLGGRHEKKICASESIKILITFQNASESIKILIVFQNAPERIKILIMF